MNAQGTQAKPRALYGLADLRLTDSISIDTFVETFEFSLLTPFLASEVSLPVLNLLLTPICYIFSFLKFVQCILFPLSTVSVWYCSGFCPPFVVSVMLDFFYIVSCFLPPYDLCCLCLTHTEDSSSVLDPNQFNSPLLLHPLEF